VSHNRCALCWDLPLPPCHPSPHSLSLSSFEPPFEEIDNTGERLVGKYWRTAGHAVVNTNFARLTPDRQSKKGALWSRKPLGVPAFSAILKFRISGQGKNFFGDGIAMWITQQAYYNPGELHGSQEKFVGIGIIFDTFRNTETINAHRDVTVLINDGEKTFEMMTDQVLGCNANIRFHSERADFSVTDSTRAKVVINNNKCVETSLPPFLFA
jgi:lectin, mannose-binding 2